MVEFRFGAVVLIEKLVSNVAYEKIGVAGPHFGTLDGHTIIFDLFIITVANSYYKQINGVAMGTVNLFHPALKYTWEISDTSLAFLDMVEGSMESRKTLEQKFIFQISTLNPLVPKGPPFDK